jgi:hypothetical protein
MFILKHPQRFYSPEGDAGSKDGDKGGDGGQKTTDADVDKMSLEDARALAKGALESKRSANAEAKGLREQRDTLQTEKDDAAKKASDAEKTTADKLTEANTKIDLMKTEAATTALNGKAKTELLAAGYPIEIVDLGISGLTEDNFKDSVKAFSKKFESYKIDSDKKPDHMTHRAKPDGKPRTAATHSVARAAMDELKGLGK